ncbi:MAG: glycosyltransferase family 4 protein [Bacteroidia bacterium]
MKILEINTEKTWRGGERQTYYNIEGIKKLGTEMELLCRKKFPLSINAATLGIKIHPVNGLFTALFFLISNGKKYDLIHTQTAKAQFYAVLTKLFHHRPIVYTRRVDFVQKGFFTKQKYLRTDKVIAISQAIKNILTNFGIRNVSIISDAIAPKNLNKKRVQKFIIEMDLQGKKILGTTAAFVQHKDPLTMVNSIYELSLLRKDFIFLHFGDGILKPLVEEKIKELQLTAVYKIMGFVEEVEDFFSIFDVFMMSSEEEGLGSSVLDAFIYKVPVITTNAGGLKEIGLERSLMSNVKDYKSLAENCNRILNDASLKIKLTDAAYEYVIKEHSIDKIAKSYQGLFLELTGNRN